jgi:hypothetical protein
MVGAPAWETGAVVIAAGDVLRKFDYEIAGRYAHWRWAAGLRENFRLRALVSAAPGDCGHLP